MDVERVIVRILADTSSYFRHMALAEAGLHRFGQSVAQINARSNAAIESINAAHGRSIASARQQYQRAEQTAVNRHTATMTRIARQRAAEELVAVRRHNSDVAAAHLAHGQYMAQAAQQAAARGLNAPATAAYMRAAQQRADSYRRLEIAAAQSDYRARMNQIAAKSAALGGAADVTRDRDIANAMARRDRAVRTAEERRNQQLAEVQRMRREALAETRLRQQALAESHYMTARSRFMQGTVIAGATIGAVGLGFAAYASKLATEYERISVAFEVMMGSAGAGAKLLGDIEALALRTPFKSQELARYGKELMAFGVSADNIVPTLEALGNVAAGTGGDMGRITLAFGQVMTAGRLMGQELRQFTNAGIPILEYLSKVLGKPVDQVRQMVHRGDVSAQAVVRAFNMMTQSGGRFAGMMDRINAETVSGRIENLTERMQIGARSFALAAFKGLGLVDVLNSIAEGSKQVDQERVARAFRYIADGVRFAYKNIVDFYNWIRRVIQSVYDWVMANELLRNGIQLFTTVFHVLSAAVRVLAVLILSIRLLLLTFNAFVFLMKLATGWVIVMNTVTRLLTIATYAQAAANVAAWVTSLGPLGLVIGLMTTLLAVMLAFGHFKDFGSSFARSMSEFADTARMAWKGIQDAFKTGDMELVFDIMWETIKVGFKTMLVSLAVEWARFWQEAVLFVISMTANIPVILVTAIFQGLGMLLKQLKVDNPAGPIGRMFNDLADMGEQLEKRAVGFREGATERVKTMLTESIGNEWKANAERDRKRWTDDMTKGNRDRINELSLRAQTNALFDTETARNVFKFQGTLEKLNLQTPEGLQTWQAAVKAQQEPKLIQEGLLGQSFTGRMFIPEAQQQYKQKWNELASATGQVRNLLAAGAPLDSPAVLEAVKRADEAAKSLNTLSTSLSKFRLASDAVKIQFEINTRAKDYHAELLDTLAKGTHPMEIFQTKMKHLSEMKGPFNQYIDEPPGGVSGFAMANLAERFGPDIKGIVSRDTWRKGAFMEYEKLRRAVSPDKETLPPVQLYGSKEAQETINRARRDQVDDATRIIKTIERGNFLLDQQLKYEEKTANELEKLNKAGVFNIRLGKLDGGGD